MSEKIKVVGIVSVPHKGGRVAIPLGVYDLVEINPPPKFASPETTSLTEEDLPRCILQAADGKKYEITYREYATYLSSGAIKPIAAE